MSRRLVPFSVDSVPAHLHVEPLLTTVSYLIAYFKRVMMDMFSSEELPEIQQVEAAMRFRSDFAQLIPSASRRSVGFKLLNKMYYFGDVVVGLEQRDPCFHVRSIREIGKHPMDVFFFILMRQGWAAMKETVGPSQIQVVDGAQPFKRQATRVDQIALLLPHSMFGSKASQIEDMHGKILSGPLTGLLADYMNSLYSRAPYIPKSEQRNISHTTISLIESCLLQNVKPLKINDESMDDLRTDRAKRYIEKNLFNKFFSVDHLVDELALSRRQIYRLFEPYGGVSHYLKSRRLTYARSRMADPNETRLIKEIAYDIGFSNATEFSRCFKKAFGYSPQEIRDMPLEKRLLRPWRDEI